MARLSSSVEEKECKCGVLYRPFWSGQTRCMRCIIEAKPENPTHEETTAMTNAFREWAVYHWYMIRKAVAEVNGIPFDFDDGVVCHKKDLQPHKKSAKQDKQTRAYYRGAKTRKQQCEEYGVDYNAVYQMALRYGYSFEDAMVEVKKREKMKRGARNG